MKIKFIGLMLGVLICGQAQAKGVFLQCWETGVAQTEENVIFQSNGGYIYEDFVVVDGEKKTDISVSSQCIDWNFPAQCEDTVILSNGDEVSMSLTKSLDFANGGDALVGELYEVEIKSVFCKRTPQ